MKVCTDCHSEVEVGWQYCHTCGATSNSPVWAIAQPGASPVAETAEPSSPFLAMLEGRASVSDGLVFHEVPPLNGPYDGEPVALPREPLPALPPAPAPSALATPALATHVLPEGSGPSRRTQRVIAAVAVTALAALGTATWRLRADLDEARTRLATTQEELDTARQGGAQPR